MATTKIAYANCQILTSEAGMACPLCGVEVQPYTIHTCSKAEEPKPTRKARKSAKEPRNG